MCSSDSRGGFAWGKNLTEMDFRPQQGSLETLVVWDQHAQDSALSVLPLLQGWLLCPAKASGIVRRVSALYLCMFLHSQVGMFWEMGLPC